MLNIKKPKIIINKVYTKTGDYGETSLIGGKRVLKSNKKVSAFGQIDELNVAVGSCLVELKKIDNVDLLDLNDVLIKIQNQLFNLGNMLAVEAGTDIRNMPRINLGYIEELEENINLYNNFNKTGDMWVKDFTALHYMYELDTFLTPVGEIIAALIPIWAIKFLTQMTLWIEFAALFAILSPLFQPWLRRLVLIIFIPFHLIILISVNIGLFSWVMFAVLILLLSNSIIAFILSSRG